MNLGRPRNSTVQGSARLFGWRSDRAETDLLGSPQFLRQSLARVRRRPWAPISLDDSSNDPDRPSSPPRPCWPSRPSEAASLPRWLRVRPRLPFQVFPTLTFSLSTRAVPAGPTSCVHTSAFRGKARRVCKGCSESALFSNSHPAQTIEGCRQPADS